MTQRVAEPRYFGVRRTMEADFPDGEGEVVGDEELFGPSDLELGARRTPRVSQRVPRGSFGGVAAEPLVGRYRAERVVSKTAHEVVVEATHLELSQRVLLRYLTPLASSSPEAVARFQRGARKARELRSEHAERLVDFGRLDSGSPYRAVELPHGPSLAEVLRVRGALPVSEAVDLVLTACEPVSEAHASGIVHRCLNTSNVFVERRSDGTPLVRVLDFGVTDPLEPDWTHGDEQPVPGSTLDIELLRYASPEQIRNPEVVDARTDVWSLGAILYELIAGAPLFHAESSLTLLAMIAADAPTPLGLLRTDVPAEVEQLVLHCLEKDPEARPRSVVELVLGLAQYASTEGRAGAARVTRGVMRTSRPPPMLSSGPVWPLQGQSRALVPTRRPTPEVVTVAPARTDWRDFGFLFAGAGIGLGAALFGLFLARQSGGPNVATQAAVPATAAATTATNPPAAPVVTPIAPLPIPTAERVFPRAVAPADPHAVAERPPRGVQRAASRSSEDPSTPSAPASAAATSNVTARTPATPSVAGERKPALTADALFGGMD